MHISRNTILTVSLLFVGLLSSSCSLLRSPDIEQIAFRKREVRGAWLPTIYRSEYMGLSREDGQKVLKERIALLKEANCNVVLFQVRAEGDAWYRSSWEPWSRFFTGKQGQAPREDWDPLAYVVGECHRQGMELHAWINPYRGSANVNSQLSERHLARKHPEWFVVYNNQIILDPGNPNSRSHILRVSKEIVEHYDIDALHLDDYFYPYPVKGSEFPDDESFTRYGLPLGYKQDKRGDWRRRNVNLLIQDLHNMIVATKPWVRLGISPFGIYRNKGTAKSGSNTNGLQNYDDLYADVLLWAKKGWIDYIVPQIYWNIGHQTADHMELAFWWSKALKKHKTQYYIGQDVKRTMDGNQLTEKLVLSQKLSEGNVYWPADELVRNYKGVTDQLKANMQPYPALLPEWRGALGRVTTPPMVDDAWISYDEHNNLSLQWPSAESSTPEEARFFGIYIFPQGIKPDVKHVQYLRTISGDNTYNLSELPKGHYTISITAINRFWKESKPFSIMVEI